MKIPYNRKRLKEAQSKEKENLFGAFIDLCLAIACLWMCIMFLKSEVLLPYFFLCMIVWCGLCMIGRYLDIRRHKPYRQLTEELYAYMNECAVCAFSWEELKQILRQARFTAIGDIHSCLTNYIYWLEAVGCFPELYADYERNVYFAKRARTNPAYTKLESRPKEGICLYKCYKQFCDACKDAPDSLLGSVEMIQKDLKLLCRLIDYNGTKGVDVHKVYSYYIPTLIDSYHTYRYLCKIKAPTRKESRQELLQSMETTHTALKILAQRISKANSSDLSVNLSALRSIIAADGLKEQELHAGI